MHTNGKNREGVLAILDIIGHLALEMLFLLKLPDSCPILDSTKENRQSKSLQFSEIQQNTNGLFTASRISSTIF